MKKQQKMEKNEFEKILVDYSVICSKSGVLETFTLNVPCNKVMETHEKMRSVWKEYQLNSKWGKSSFIMSPPYYMEQDEILVSQGKMPFDDFFDKWYKNDFPETISKF